MGLYFIYLLSPFPLLPLFPRWPSFHVSACAINLLVPGLIGPLTFKPTPGRCTKHLWDLPSLVSPPEDTSGRLGTTAIFVSGSYIVYTIHVAFIAFW